VENLGEDGRRRVKGDTRGKENSKANKRERNIMFWNIASISNKDKDFWKYVRNFDFISLCETWLEENEWKKVKGRLPSSHK